MNERSFIVKSPLDGLTLPSPAVGASTVGQREVPASRTNYVFDPKIVASFPPNRRYLIGVSGGRDSVALLHQLVDLGYRRLVVCHLDHQLRGRASKADARFVERLAAKLDCEFEIDRTDVAALARKSKQSIETAGRTARYEFFARVARRRRCHTIFLGHHADDLVETFLMNLFRGRRAGGLRRNARDRVAPGLGGRNSKSCGRSSASGAKKSTRM